MTTTAPNYAEAATMPRPAPAGSFLDGLAARDFDRLADALTPSVRLRALLPSGLREWSGAEVADRFAGWFGNTEAFEVVEAMVAEVGDRLHVHWRFRLQAARLGDGWFAVEQQAYADTSDDGRIARLDLLCSGYRPEDSR